MNIAYLILAHTDIKQLIRLCHELLKSGDCFIHLDKKNEDKQYWSSLESLEKKTSTDEHKIIVLKNRVNVYWGGFSQVFAERELLKRALEGSVIKYDRIVILSGLCYPLYNPAQIQEFFRADKNREYLNAFDMTENAYGAHLKRFKGYHFFRDSKIPGRLKRFVVAGTRDLLWALGITKSNHIVRNGIKEHIYFGGQWISLTRECATYVLSQLYNSTYLNYFKTCYAPDELCIHTIVMNSKFRGNATLVDSDISNGVKIFQELSPLHKLHYQDSIKIYTDCDYNELINSKKMFVRKVISGDSDKLIDMLSHY